jgi:hypothetical protein
MNVDGHPNHASQVDGMDDNVAIQFEWTFMGNAMWVPPNVEWQGQTLGNHNT